MKKIYSFIIIFFIANLLYSKTCKDFTLFEIYNLSDYVFIGEIIEHQDTFFTVKILEIFKGALKEYDTIKIEIDSNFKASSIGDYWIFYVDYTEINNIQMIGCGWSREVFEYDDIYFIPPPPPHKISDKGISKENIDYLLFSDYKIYEKLNYNKLHQELIYLRGIKNRDRTIKLEEDLNELKEKFTLLINLIIIFFFCLVFLLLYYLKRKKRGNVPIL